MRFLCATMLAFGFSVSTALCADHLIYWLNDVYPPTERALNDSAAGTVSCQRDSERGACRISWDLPVNAKEYWVEFLDPENATWIRAPEPYHSSRGIDRDHAIGGRLYRVVGCNSDGHQCVSTQVHWVLFHAASADQIPELTSDECGSFMKVSKNGDLGLQEHQYNAYLLTRLLNMAGGRLADFPSMAVPAKTPLTDSPDSFADDDLIRLSVYRQYEGRRGHAERGRLMQGCDGS